MFSLFTGTAPGTGQEDIYTASANGKDLVNVTNTPEFEDNADWGPHPLAT